MDLYQPAHPETMPTTQYSLLAHALPYPSIQGIEYQESFLFVPRPGLAIFYMQEGVNLSDDYGRMVMLLNNETLLAYHL